MKSALDQIENRLQMFFENYLINRGGKKLYTEVAQSMLDALENNIISQDSEQLAPNIFKIYLNLERLPNPEELTYFSEMLKAIIQSTCEERGQKFSGPICIQFFIDKEIQQRVHIDTSFSFISMQKTEQIINNFHSRGEESKALTSYLILPPDEFFKLRKNVVNIGRSEDNDVVIDNLLVSRLHAQIRVIDGKHIIFDINSCSGTKVNGQRIYQHPLNAGDVIEIADVSFIYYCEPDDKFTPERGNSTQKIS